MDRRWLLAAAVALASVLAGVWWGRGVDTGPSATSPAPLLPAPAPSTITSLVVHVAGWVSQPGLVSVRSGARVGDAVAAAGGARPGARLDSMNLAEPLVDGQQVLVPGPGDETHQGGAEQEAGDGLIHLNSATATELESLPGVGPVLAERIVAHRDSHGPFQQVEDLLDVSGIGEAKLGSIRELVTVP